MTSERARWSAALVCVAGALTGVRAPAHAALGPGSSGWSWGSPLPQGNTLRAMSFGALPRTRGYAAGDFGTLLRSDDFGRTWVGLSPGTRANLTAVQAFDPATVVVAGGCVARRSDDGGSTFTPIAFTPDESRCPAGLAAMHFTDPYSGYFVLTDGTVLRTTDGGAKFTRRAPVPGTRAAGGTAQPTAVSFDSTGGLGLVATTAGRIFQAQDAALSWRQDAVTPRPVRDLTFATPRLVYAVGDGSLVMARNQGNWKVVSFGPSNPIKTPRALAFTNVECASSCFIAERTGTVLVRYTFPDFSVITPPVPGILTTTFVLGRRVVGAGERGAMVITNDAYEPFTPLGQRLAGRFRRLHAGGVAGSAYVAGLRGALARTSDGGSTWSPVSVPTSQDLRDVAFPTLADGYVLDAAGRVLRTSDGGSQWRVLQRVTSTLARALYAPSRTSVLLVGTRGIRRSTDAGATFAPVPGTSRTSLGNVDRAGRAIVAWGGTNLLLSANGGRTWRTVGTPGAHRNRGRPVHRVRLQGVDFISASTGYVLDAQRRLWKTANGGNSWTERTGVGTNSISAMAFSDAKRGYVTTQSFGDVTRPPAGVLLRTTDGGATWHPQLVTPDPIGSDGIAAPGGERDYVLAGDSSLLFTTTGGDVGKHSTLAISAARTRLRRPGRATVTGRLLPAAGGTRVTVSYRPPGSPQWRHKTVTTRPDGSFTTSWDMRRGANLFVAQWAGHKDVAGDGSPVLVVHAG